MPKEKTTVTTEIRVREGFIAYATGAMGRTVVALGNTHAEAMEAAQLQLDAQLEEEKAFAREYEQDQRNTAHSIANNPWGEHQ
jgi:hypothetical protein